MVTKYNLISHAYTRNKRNLVTTKIIIITTNERIEKMDEKS